MWVELNANKPFHVTQFVARDRLSEANVASDVGNFWSVPYFLLCSEALPRSRILEKKILG